jgi:hypothetical protein
MEPTLFTVTPLKMEPTLVTETSEVKTQTPGKFPEESTLEYINALTHK